ncbi:MAG: hypothetical protein ACLR0U_11450 [Enterocloster clostridioformis]
MDTVSSCVPRAEGEGDNFAANRPDFPAERIFRELTMTEPRTKERGSGSIGYYSASGDQKVAGNRGQ